jgi:hypothetical protein
LDAGFHQRVFPLDACIEAVLTEEPPFILDEIDKRLNSSVSTSFNNWKAMISVVVIIASFFSIHRNPISRFDFLLEQTTSQNSPWANGAFKKGLTARVNLIH